MKPDAEICSHTTNPVTGLTPRRIDYHRRPADITQTDFQVLLHLQSDKEEGFCYYKTIQGILVSRQTRVQLFILAGAWRSEEESARQWPISRDYGCYQAP